MKKQLFFSIFVLFLLHSCMSIDTIHTIDDDYKKEHIIYLSQTMNSNSLEKKIYARQTKIIYLTWEKTTSKALSCLAFELKLENYEKLDPYFFTKPKQDFIKFLLKI